MEIRIKYISWADGDEPLLDKKFEFNSIEEAEKFISDGYSTGVYNDEKGELSVFVDGEEKEFDLVAKIKM